MSRFAFLAAAILAANFSSAESLEEIVEKAVRAGGGRERIKAVRAERMTGRFRSATGVESPLSVDLQRSDRIRTEIHFPEGTFIQAFDGKSGWLQSPWGASREPTLLPAREAHELAESADLDGPLVDWKQRGLALTLLGREKVEGRDVFRILVTLPDGAVRRLALDASSYLKFEWEGELDKGGTKTTFVSLFDDYRAVAGLRLPFRIRSSVRGSAASTTIMFDKVEVDPEIDPSRFSLAPAGKR